MAFKWTSPNALVNGNTLKSNALYFGKKLGLRDKFQASDGRLDV